VASSALQEVNRLNKIQNGFSKVVRFACFFSHLTGYTTFVFIPDAFLAIRFYCCSKIVHIYLLFYLVYIYLQAIYILMMCKYSSVQVRFLLQKCNYKPFFQSGLKYINSKSSKSIMSKIGAVSSRSWKTGVCLALLL
jgi:hypothetical protein